MAASRRDTLFCMKCSAHAESIQFIDCFLEQAVFYTPGRRNLISIWRLSGVNILK
ncbi:Polyadenylate-binding protein, cytoplasmic and nuclear, partial [Clarias magur]